MRKGISPLVAAVILIASTMMIAAILSFWASSFVKKELSEAENTTTETRCTVAQFRIYSGSYNNASEVLFLVLENQRSFDLELKDLYLFYSDNLMKPIPLNEKLEGNQLKSINVSDVTNNFNNGVIKTNCPDVSASFTYSQVA